MLEYDLQSEASTVALALSEAAREAKRERRLATAAWQYRLAARAWNAYGATANGADCERQAQVCDAERNAAPQDYYLPNG